MILRIPVDLKISEFGLSDEKILALAEAEGLGMMKSQLTSFPAVYFEFWQYIMHILQIYSRTQLLV